jgi:hypothetical protein
MESAPEGEVSARADLVSALLWLAFGGAILIGSWRMDRLANLNINKYEAPGLVPGLLGTTLVLLGVMLAVRSIRRGALAPAGPRSSDWRNVRWDPSFAARPWNYWQAYSLTQNRKRWR